MFHSGDLQSGIALAIQQQKLVACFIYQPDDATSKQWEEEYLTANTCSGNVCGQLRSLMGDKAVLLRIEFGSTEAGFLSAFCPVEKAPVLVVIRNGQVLDKIEGEVEKDDFVERVRKAVGIEDLEDGDTTTGAGDGSTQEESEAQQSGAQQTAASSSQQMTSPNEPSQAHTLLAERARRIEADRLRQEGEEKAARLARQKARQREAEEASAAHRATTTSESNEKEKARNNWIYQQKQRKDEAKKEKQRILQQIEADKQERKAAALRRKEDADAGVGDAAGGYSEMKGAEGSKNADRSIGSAKCALQIRLFDGSSIKAKFASDADLATAVRTWVKEAAPEGGADIPYSFRQILAPKPSRSIEVGEENQSLFDLGLTPSATLVLVPVSGTVDAYTNANTGYVGSAVNGAYWVANTAYDYAGALLGAAGFGGGSANAGQDSGPYMAGTGDPQEKSNVQGARMADTEAGIGGSKVKVKTLADQRAEQARKDEDSTEFYNGNSSAFQGNDGKDK